MGSDARISQKDLRDSARYPRHCVLSGCHPIGARRQRHIERSLNVCRRGTTQHVAPALDSLRSLSDISKRYVWYTENRAFLLNGSAVAQHRACMFFELHEVEKAERSEHAKISRVESELLHLVSGPWMNAYQHRNPMFTSHLGQPAEEPPKTPRDVNVLRSMD